MRLQLINQGIGHKLLETYIKKNLEGIRVDCIT